MTETAYACVGAVFAHSGYTADEYPDYATEINAYMGGISGIADIEPYLLADHYCIGCETRHNGYEMFEVYPDA